ncbi:MAG: hypothetical protein AVDCRST_MAG21-766 [uncultured Nocardioidaceae bacterium]|uniref:Actinobacteria/chloroflexi VLRF1 release factor domain-containing protein n=1 Tax=uncultured Nocardioidaceae bacterium TaxID=253824 RepID=A0A6J4MWJ0_9ACTN|nr:MAG: hypothetical protein AVDCRST_MAG21-766 [uncultured Nocardioidaceae bacterium]
MPAARLPGWVDRFAERHGELSWSATDASATGLDAADGAAAVLHWPLPGVPVGDLDGLATRAGAADSRNLVLVRRGGWAVGSARGAELVRSRCGTRYVQGKTKAGGWSQQRYARRRAQQADGLLEAVEAAVREVLAGTSGPVVLGGDRALLDRLLSSLGDTDVPSRVSPRRLDVPDPRLAVLRQAVVDAGAVEIDLNELA